VEWDVDARSGEAREATGPHTAPGYIARVGLKVKLRRSYTADPTTEWWQAFAEFTQLFVCSWMKFWFAGKDR